MTNQTFLTIKADLSASFNKRRKAVGNKITTSGTGKKRHCQYKYSANKRVDIGKSSTEVFWLPYLLRHLGNTCILLQVANLSTYKK